jgi:hypothetical protein
MALPFLPGYSFDQKLGKNRFHKSQAFDYRNEVPVFLGQNKPGIGKLPYVTILRLSTCVSVRLIRL